MTDSQHYIDFTDKKNGLLKGRALLINEIEKAKAEWAAAQQKLEYVTEQDQIDYAIYSLEAAEKKYEMLIRQAKKQNIHRLEDQ